MKKIYDKYCGIDVHKKTYRRLLRIRQKAGSSRVWCNNQGTSYFD